MFGVFTKNLGIINYAVLAGLIFVLSGCASALPEASATVAVMPTTAPTFTPSFTATPAYPWTDENAIVSGVCFEAALDAAGRVFVLRSADEHIRFYDQADNSHLCRHPVTRYPFDFSTGRVLAGLWSYGRGCTARHEVMSVTRDDTARTFTIRLHFVTEGDCNYELVRPFWVGLDGLSDYTVTIIPNP